MPAIRQRLDFIQRIQVPLLLRAEQQGDGAPYASLRGVLQQGQHRCQSAAAGNQHQWRVGRAQPEVAVRPVDVDPLADHAAFIDQCRQRTARDFADKEANLRIRLRRRCERIAARDIEQRRQAEIGELPGLVIQAGIKLDPQLGDVVRQATLSHHASAHLAPRRTRAQIHLERDIGQRHRLAGEDVAQVQFLLRQHVAGLGQFLDPAFEQPAFAGGAAAHPAAVRKVHALPQCRLQQGFLGGDRNRHAIDAHRRRSFWGEECKHVLE